MKWARNYLAKAAKQFDLPEDILTGGSRVEMIGNSRCSVEPHGGLQLYSSSEICINTLDGLVAVQGTDLEVKLMNKDRIVICGLIHTVHLRVAEDE